MTKQELIDRLNSLYGVFPQNVRVEESLEPDGTHRIEAMVRVGVGIRIQEADISEAKLSEARESIVKTLGEAIK